MSDNDVLAIKGELNTLKAITEEKWASHDKRADERWVDLMDKMHAIENKKTPCDDHIKNMLEMNGRIKAIERWIDIAGWAIGVVYIAVVGALIKVYFV